MKIVWNAHDLHSHCHGNMLLKKTSVDLYGTGESGIHAQ
jgi:hypothetical protein